MFIVDKEAGNRARQQLEALATAIGLECDASLASYVGDGSSLRPFLTVDQARRAQETQPTRAIQIIMYGTGTINPAVQPTQPTPRQQDIIDAARRCYSPPVSLIGNGSVFKDATEKLAPPVLTGDRATETAEHEAVQPPPSNRWPGDQPLDSDTLKELGYGSAGT